MLGIEQARKPDPRTDYEVEILESAWGRKRSIDRIYLRHFEEPVESKPVEVIEGEVGKIVDEEAIVVFHTEGTFVERIFPLHFLVGRDAGFEGARIRMTVTENEGTISARVEKMDDRPLWAIPDEEMMQVMRDLKQLSSRPQQNPLR